MTTTTPASTGYAPVNGLAMYYEMYGSGRPLVLLHGGLLTVGLSFGPLLPTLVARHRAIGVELQGHGHTADVDREMTIDQLADDVRALLDHLGIERADVFGFSLGGLVSLRLAMLHPDRVDRLVLAATPYRPDGFHDDIRDPALHATSTRMPTEADFTELAREYARVAPDPGHFEAFAAKTNEMVLAFTGWRDDELRAVRSRTLLIVGDHDFVRLEHAVAMHELIPDAQLAVLPGTTHANLMRRTDLLAPIVESFLVG